MIATVGPSLPIDLLEATGRHAGPLGWDLDQPTPTADGWLESKFPLWAKAVLEQWATGTLDHLELVLFSRADDAAQRLYYYICELQRRDLLAGPEPLILDIARVPRASSLDHTIAALRRLAERLGVDDGALEQAITRTNAARAATGAAAPRQTPACLLVGTPPPAEALHQAIAAAGFAPHGPTLAQVWADPGPPVTEGTGDPLAAIGRQLHARPDDQRGFASASQRELARVRAAGAAVAIQWYAEEDEARVWDAPAIRDALAAAGIPTLMLSRRDAAFGDGAPEEIRTFLAGVN